MSTDSLPRLRWSCRRGMLELDVLLGNFLEEVYLTLKPDDQTLFTRLLDFSDQELFLWLTGKEEALDPEIAKMIEMIRRHAKNRH